MERSRRGRCRMVILRPLKLKVRIPKTITDDPKYDVFCYEPVAPPTRHRVHDPVEVD